MKLIVRKFNNSESQISVAVNKIENILLDIVVGAEIGFAYKVNNREFYNFHTFCFHYCLDAYNGEKNISFHILSPNEQTNEYCFWKYSQNFFNENVKSRKFEIDKSQILVNKVNVGFAILKNESFDSVVDKLKKDLWNTHEKILENFDNAGINYNYDIDMEDFSKKLKDFIEQSYSDIRQSELSDLIKKYDMLSLSHNLSKKENVRNKKIKI